MYYLNYLHSSSLGMCTYLFFIDYCSLFCFTITFTLRSNREEPRNTSKFKFRTNYYQHARKTIAEFSYVSNAEGLHLTSLCS